MAVLSTKKRILIEQRIIEMPDNTKLLKLTFFDPYKEKVEAYYTKNLSLSKWLGIWTKYVIQISLWKEKES